MLLVDEHSEVAMYEADSTLARTVPLPAGAESYGIATGGPPLTVYVANNGSGEVEAYEEVAIKAPTVDEVAPSASGISSTSALLSGKVDTGSAPDASYQFVYGETEAYGRATPLRVITANALAGPESVTGLRPETTYHFALVATNEIGTTMGPDYTFMTGQATPPAAQTGVAEDVSHAGATLTGTVEGRGMPTAYGFELAAGGYAYGAPLIAGNGPGTEGEAVALTLTGLQPGTTYRYRLFATNQDGTTYGAERQFTTAALPSQLALPTVLPTLTTPSIAFPIASGALSVEGIAIVRRSFNGHAVTLRVRVPAAGRLVAKGAGLRSASRRVAAGRTVTLELRLSKRGLRSLSRRRGGRAPVKIRVVFTAVDGRTLTATVTLTVR
jgi:hypothetical protein